MGTSEEEPEFDLNDAYGVETPDDNRELYRRWASSFDDGFAASHGYVYDDNVAKGLADRSPDWSQPILDVGCGTGLVGLALSKVGAQTLDGIDLSPEMLEFAKAKRVDDQPLYRDLFEADLTQPITLSPGTYGSLVSAGTFTHGHLGPEPITRLVELIAPGGTGVIGVNSDHYASAGFEATINGLVEGGTITDLELVVVRVYDADSYTADDVEHIDSTSTLVVFTKA